MPGPLRSSVRPRSVTLGLVRLGLAVLTLGDFDLTGEITSGSLGGLLHVRDVSLPAHIGRLDQLAYDVAGIAGALGSLLAFVKRLRTGRGGGERLRPLGAGLHVAVMAGEIAAPGHVHLERAHGTTDERPATLGREPLREGVGRLAGR